MAMDAEAQQATCSTSVIPACLLLWAGLVSAELAFRDTKLVSCFLAGWCLVLVRTAGSANSQLPSSTGVYSAACKQPEVQTLHRVPQGSACHSLCRHGVNVLPAGAA
jgi:hypothetical protein